MESLEKNQQKSAQTEVSLEFLLLHLPISELGLSARPYNCLESARIRTVGDILSHTEQDLLSIRWLGDESLREIKHILMDYNLSLKRYGSNASIILPIGKRGRKRNGTKKNESRDLDILEGLALREYGIIWDMSYQGARNYILKSGQHETWKEARKRKLEEEKIKRNPEFYSKQAKRVIAGQVVNIMYRRAIEEGNLPWQKAIEYFYSRKTRPQTTTIKRLVKLFGAYYTALERGDKLSLEELSEISGIKGFPHVGRILSKVGLEPMYGAREIKFSLSKEKAEAIGRVFDLDMSIPDIAHFLDVPSHVVSQRFNRIGPRPRRKFIYQAGFGTERLNYRLLSQICEAADLGFTKEETAELFDTTLNIVNYANENRPSLEKVLIDSLRTIFPERKISKPYLQGN
ncbi:MAG: DNA-directed RNA polymerase subunit alpha C-terminal domain-containing protein [Nanoarchaeota archaeon]